jgi:aldose sugar dehydrogenase
MLEFLIRLTSLMWLFVGLFGAASHAQQTKAPVPAQRVAVTVETVAKGLEHPWGLQFLADGRMLVTERPGRMRIVRRDGTLSPPLAGVPTVAAVGQGGLLDVALDPAFASNQRIYFTFAEPRRAGNSHTSVARARLVLEGAGGRLEDVTVIFRQEPGAGGGFHFGSRIAFARDGAMFVVLGERFQRNEAQNKRTHLGKVVRIDTDGKALADNPFADGREALPEIWSTGHRNAQAAAIHPVTGKLWLVEHGPRGGDEINVAEKGKNYGWPAIGYGIDYSGAIIHEGTSKAGMEQPVYYWVPSIAPSGMAFYTGDLVPAWKGNLFVGALAGQHLARLVLDGERVVGEEKLLGDLGERIRDVRMGPDGALWLLTDSPTGRVLRVVGK